jgi:hypothetical protein
MDGELGQLGERIAEQAAHLDAAMHRLLADLRAFDERGGWHVQGALSCAHWLSWRVGWDLVTARERVRVARKLAGFPTIDDALRRGEISYSKVRALVRVATPANEDLLLEHARLIPASQLEKLSRKYALVQRHDEAPHPAGDEQRRYVRRRDTEDGMVKLEAVLHPEEAELVWAMLHHAATQLARGPAAPASDSAGAGGAALQQEAAGDSATPASDSAGAGGAALQQEAAGDLAAFASDSAGAGGVAPQQEAAGDSLTPASDSAGVGGAARLQEAAGNSAASSEAALPRNAVDSPLPQGFARDERDGRDGSEESKGRVEIAASAASQEVTEPSSEHGGSVLRQRAAAARRAWNRADALVAIAQGYLRGDRPERSPIEITLTIPASSLQAQAGEVGETGEVGEVGEMGEMGEAGEVGEVGEMGESFISPATARRLGCDAGVIEVIEDEHGVPLLVGRKRRTVSGALKRALYRRDQACTFPGCTHRAFLEGHHIKHWADGGETSLQNTALLCSAHHRYVHEYGYEIELGADGRPQLRNPHGLRVTAAPARPAVADLGWPGIRAANALLSISADTIACGWDGRPVDYGKIAGHLAGADELE